MWGKVRQGEEWKGKVRWGNVRYGKVGYGRVRYGTARRGKERKGTERKATVVKQGNERKWTETKGKGKEWKGKGRQGNARNGQAKERKGKQKKEVEWKGTGRKGKERPGKDGRGKKRKQRKGRAWTRMEKNMNGIERQGGMQRQGKMNGRKEVWSKSLPSVRKGHLVIAAVGSQYCLVFTHITLRSMTFFISLSFSWGDISFFYEPQSVALLQLHRQTQLTIDSSFWFDATDTSRNGFGTEGWNRINTFAQVTHSDHNSRNNFTRGKRAFVNTHRLRQNQTHAQRQTCEKPASSWRICFRLAAKVCSSWSTEGVNKGPGRGTKKIKKIHWVESVAVNGWKQSAVTWCWNMNMTKRNQEQTQNKQRRGGGHWWRGGDWKLCPLSSSCYHKKSISWSHKRIFCLITEKEDARWSIEQVYEDVNNHNWNEMVGNLVSEFDGEGGKVQKTRLPTDFGNTPSCWACGEENVGRPCDVVSRGEAQKEGRSVDGDQHDNKERKAEADEKWW